MQLPQYMPAAPAVTYAILMRGGLLLGRLFLWFRQEEGQKGADGVDAEADGGGGVGDAREARQAGRDESRTEPGRKQLSPGPKHSPADIGREALAGATQVYRI